MIPSSRSLFKAINGFVKLAYMRGIIRVNKARRLSHINCFWQVTLEESIVYIQVTKGPTIAYGKTKHKSDSSWFDYETKCFKIIHTWSLMKSFGYKTRFIPVNRTIRFSFTAKNLLTTYKVCDISWRNEFPCPIATRASYSLDMALCQFGFLRVGGIWGFGCSLGF